MLDYLSARGTKKHDVLMRKTQGKGFSISYTKKIFQPAKMFYDI